MNDADVLVKIEEIATYLNLSSVQIRKLEKLGLPKFHKNQYPLLACFQWYIAYLRGFADEEMKKEKLRLMRAKADRMDIENQKLKSQSIDIESIRQQIIFIVQTFREGLLGLAGTLCHRLESKDAAEIRSLLDYEIRCKLNEIAEAMDATREQGFNSESCQHGSENKALCQSGGMGQPQQSFAK